MFMNLDNATVLMETQMPAVDYEGAPIELRVRVLTDTEENALEVTPIYNGDDPAEAFYIPVSGEYVSVLVSFESFANQLLPKPE